MQNICFCYFCSDGGSSLPLLVVCIPVKNLILTISLQKLGYFGDLLSTKLRHWPWIVLKGLLSLALPSLFEVDLVYCCLKRPNWGIPSRQFLIDQSTPSLRGLAWFFSLSGLVAHLFAVGRKLILLCVFICSASGILNISSSWPEVLVFFIKTKL